MNNSKLFVSAICLLGLTLTAPLSTQAARGGGGGGGRGGFSGGRPGFSGGQFSGRGGVGPGGGGGLLWGEHAPRGNARPQKTWKSLAPHTLTKTPPLHR